MNHEPDSERGQVADIARAIFEAIADPIFVIEFSGDGLAETFSYVNEATCRLLNRSRAELLTLRPGTVDEVSESVMDGAYERLMRDGRATFETLMISSTGERIPVEIHASDARLADKRVCIAVARSLVARKEIDDRMREAKEAAEAANQAKSEFLAMMSHEIRTPLHGVIGFASLLDGDDPQRLRETVEGIRTSANLLLALVTDVLDFSRIEAGQLELQPVPWKLALQLRRIAVSFGLRAEKKGLAFHYVEDPALPSSVLADSLRIEQVLGNLLGNALKFTERGSITLKVSVAPRDGTGECEISFAVSDTGIGIREDRLQRLFKPFSQADSSLARHHGGSGLGLVIVRRLCELMGGTVAVQSGFGQGSVFTASIVALPAGEADAASSRESVPSTPEDSARPLRILVAEDNSLNRKLMGRMIERLGCTARFATDGREAIGMVEEDTWDLIFMDVGMPGVSGLDATRAIRAGERTTGRPASRIVALTAGVSENERSACSDAGMDDFLGKPFTEEGLRTAIKRAQDCRDVA